MHSADSNPNPQGFSQPHNLSRSLQINSRKRAQSIHGIDSARNLSFQFLVLCTIQRFTPPPPPFSFHPHENNKVTSIMTKIACKNKQLTPEPLSAEAPKQRVSRTDVNFPLENAGNRRRGARENHEFMGALRSSGPLEVRRLAPESMEYAGLSRSRCKPSANPVRQK